MSIHINVVNQKMHIASHLDDIVEGSQKFVEFKFNLSKDWDGLRVFAQFNQNGQAYNEYLDENNSVHLPAAITAGKCSLMLYGNKDAIIGTTNCLTLKISECNLVSDVISTDIPASLYDDLVSRLDHIVGSGENSLNFNGGNASGDYSVAFNRAEAIGDYAFAENEGALAGCLGFYIKSINILKDDDGNTVGGEIYLSDLAAPIVATRGAGVIDADFGAYVFPADDSGEEAWVSVEADGYYHWPHAAKITAIEHNKITYDGVIKPVDYWESGAVHKNGTEQQPFLFFIATQPKAGIVKVGTHSHAEGLGTFSAGNQSHAEGYGTQAIGRYAHAEGMSTVAGYASHSEGKDTAALGLHSHAEGNGAVASGHHSHAEGWNSSSSGSSSHAEGRDTLATGDNSHSEGYLTKATAFSAHAEGYNTKALGSNSHAEGANSIAQGARSHAEGSGTVAYSPDQHVQGRNNIEDIDGVYAHIVGWGSSSTNRKNIHTIDTSGNAWFAGKITTGADGKNVVTTVNGTAPDKNGNVDVQGIYYIDMEGYSLEFDWAEVLSQVKAGREVVIRQVADSTITQYYHLTKTSQYDSESEIDTLVFTSESGDYIDVIDLFSSGNSRHSSTDISHVCIDPTLSRYGQAADAKMVGDKLGDIETALDSILAIQEALIGGDSQ